MNINQLVKCAYIIRALVKDEDLDIKFSGENIEFKIFDTFIKTNTIDFFISTIDDETIDIEIKDENDLYGYITVQVMKHTGMDRHLECCCKLSDLSYNYIKIVDRISKRMGRDIGSLFEESCLAIGRPESVAVNTQLPETLIKSIRVLNRKNILKSAIKQGIDDYNNQY